MSNQRGIALLLVLWVLALLSLMLATLASAVQLQNRQALWERQHFQALLAAQAGMNIAIAGFADLKTRPAWQADGRVHALEFDEAKVEVSIRSERGYLDANAGSEADFARLLTACHSSERTAMAIARALGALRLVHDVAIHAIEQLRELPGMSREIYLCVAPHMTLWSGQTRPDPATATSLLRTALKLPKTALAADGGAIFTVESIARLPTAHEAAVRTTVLLQPAGLTAAPYRILQRSER